MSTIPAKLDRERAALLVVDVQEGFRRAIPDFDALSAAVATMVRGAEAIGIPILLTEQYPKGLGEAERAGAWLTSVETALFELLGAAGNDEFKAVQRLVLELAP